MTTPFVSDDIADAFFLAYIRAVALTDPSAASRIDEPIDAQHRTDVPAPCVRDCGRPRYASVGRGLCRSCYKQLKERGELDAYPTLPRGKPRKETAQ